MDSSTLLIDCRNDKEVQIGTFSDAVNPKTKTYNQFPTWVDKNKSTILSSKKKVRKKKKIRRARKFSYANALTIVPFTFIADSHVLHRRDKVREGISVRQERSGGRDGGVPSQGWRA